jgi:predicted nucleic acid-binding protein
VGGGEGGQRVLVNGVVADASPLIAFHQIGQLPLLQALFTKVLVPPAVAREIAPSVPNQSKSSRRASAPARAKPSVWPSSCVGVVPAVRPLIDALLEKNFWINPQLVEHALAEIGERTKP